MLEQLIELRKCKKLTIQNMADVLGIAKSTYASYETGYRQPPIDALIKIADFFNISLDTLVNRDFASDIHLDKMHTKDCRLLIDDEKLTADELKEIIAFIKVKRGLS
ncbi:helix-turn-helix domain-containing protein [Sporolactobacillus laevolacticus]|uniref:XRE family transcriptional regulator n=1 Tax=Sporolactobacillus laevolacticus DSM 442 TaxID=1395513 RepID=V6J057_9BACL|nr:helix-turn-helix transcriptional regulator [Sporolactobacillus laevolacticus]EST12541.1 XRE family transcriptional regulator [Sporolactobacillus laevolacticus DSM 442]